MIRLAYYGKGGIGKSTLAANISGILAKEGKRVLHIGCDPKADSTRILAIKPVRPILDRLRDGEDLGPDELLTRGKYGTYLVECGGPQAGVGCAGLGITTAIDLLEGAGIFDMEWDLVAYDVLGDVVCGGFAVPLKNHYVDQVNLVASSDFMALYAANNILRALDYYDRKTRPLRARLILNHHAQDWDLRVGQAFSQKTGLEEPYPIDQDLALKKADYQGELLVDMKSASKNLARIYRLSQDILEEKNLAQTQAMDADLMDEFRREIYELE